MRVYRVEHSVLTLPNGFRRGPYRNLDLPSGSRYIALSNKIADSHDGMSSHPTPFHDGIASIWPDELCGFKTVHDLKAWFGNWLNELAVAGFVMAEYEVQKNRVKLGMKQLAFAGDEAKRVKVTPLTMI